MAFSVVNRAISWYLGDIIREVVRFISNRIQQWNNTTVDISKHIETLLHLPVITIEAAGLIKLATKIHNKI